MKGWLLDTNVLSEIRRPKPQQTVVDFITKQPLSSLFISVVSLSEIRFGIELLDDPARRSALNTWLTHIVRPMFEGRVLPFSEDVILKWRLMVEEGRKSGHTFSQPDLFIAATALYHGLTVVTRDVRGYERAKVPLFNPWLS